MNNLIKEISDEYLSGLSIHKIAKKYNLNYSFVRYHLVKNNVYKPKSKFKENGRVICKCCNKKYLEKDMPKDYYNSGKRLCASCLSRDQLKYNMKKLGATEEIYDKLYLEQNAQCDICKTKVGHKTTNGKNARLALDHCHKTNTIRGLLCNKCNRCLGYLNEDIDYINKVVEYLKKHQAD